MTELSISPLARRIAEENNVDWRALEGSDAGGGVNERDVLNYLEGVMLGTKPVDPTPEPLPEGMSAWAEERAAPQGAVPTVTADSTGAATLKTAVPDAAPTPEQTATDQTAAAELARAEDSYRELFAELGTLKKAAADAEEERRKEREVAAGVRAEAQLELTRTQETLASRETELTELRTQLSNFGAEAKTREQSANEAQLELTRLRETVNAQEKELTQVQALKQQVETLKAQLGGAEAQAKEVADLTGRLAKADATTRKAQAEAEQLKTANAGLERIVAELKAARLQVAEPEKRPWWKLWG